MASSEFPSIADEPPPRVEGKKKPRASENIKRALQDAESVKEMKEFGQSLLYFDHQSPAVRNRRAVARQVFEDFCEMKLGSENLSAKEMWNKETICERTWECLFRMAKYARGQSTEKPKAGVLYQQKEGMYWWIIRLIPDFISIYSYWHHISNAAIQKAALQYGFEKSFRPKHDLTGAELSLFWDQIPRFRVGLDNWKQHYAAWVTVWITSVRPGSLTTCVGYEKDSLLGDNKSRRAEDETLRWSDMQFFRLNDGGIGCKIQFRFIKGARDPYSRKVVHGTRRFTILPLNGDQYHLDLALLMTALAYSRGLFANVASPEDLFSGTLVNIAKDPRIDQQAVFVASDQSNTLLQNQPMHEKHLTPKLQEMCTAVGLLQRNTMYSLRRTAITESRRKHGTEHAQDLAFHARGGASIYAYDDLAYQDFDIANDRNNLDGMSRTQIREMFSQAATSRIDITDDALMGFGDSEANLQKKFNTESMRRARTDPTNIANEASLRDLRNEATQLLLSLGVVEEFLVHDQDIRDHLSNQAATSEECKAKHNDIQMLEATNKTTLRRLQAQYKKIIKTELQKEIEKNQQVIARKKRSTLGTSGSISGPEREAQGPEGEDLAGFDTDARANVDNLNTDESEEGDEALEHEGSEDVAEEQADHTRTEPAQWEQLPEEIVIHQEADEDSKDPTLAGRLQFIKDFVATRDARTSGLTCTQCYYDDTVPSNKKTQTYTMSSLDKHLKQDYHSRESQLLRAFDIDKDGSGKVNCPICHDMTLTRRGFIEHFKDVHDDQMAM